METAPRLKVSSDRLVKPGIEPATPGLQGKRLIHYTTAAPYVRTCDTNNKFIIFSDSLSVLKAMVHTSSKNPQFQKLLEKWHELLANKEITLCWIPSHIVILGNEMVDQQAKTSLSLEPTSF